MKKAAASTSRQEENSEEVRIHEFCWNHSCFWVLAIFYLIVLLRAARSFVIEL